MNTLVAYMSQSGNTKKVANAIYETIEENKEIKELKEVESLDGYDLAFIGFPIHAFGPAQQGKDFLVNHGAGKKLAVFITHAADEEQELTATWVNACLEAAAEADVLGTFHCQGELAEAIAEMLKKSDDPQMQEFGNQRDSTIGQPDASRIEKAKAFAKEIMQKV